MYKQNTWGWLEAMCFQWSHSDCNFLRSEDNLFISCWAPMRSSMSWSPGTSRAELLKEDVDVLVARAGGLAIKLSDWKPCQSVCFSFKRFNSSYMEMKHQKSGPRVEKNALLVSAVNSLREVLSYSNSNQQYFLSISFSYPHYKVISTQRTMQKQICVQLLR